MKKPPGSDEPGGFAVRTKGLEPSRRKALDPKSSAATNYATCAFSVAKVVIFIQ